jgi:hypothetical protein
MTKVLVTYDNTYGDDVSVSSPNGATTIAGGHGEHQPRGSDRRQIAA